MEHRRAWAPVAGMVAAGLLVAAGSVLTAQPAPAYGHVQTGCVPAGADVSPVPWAQFLLEPERAWSLSTGEGQRVAVVSTGVDETPYLTGTLAGRVDLSPSDEPAEPSGKPDCLGIGTGVAGIIAAPPTDGVGFHGLAPGARIIDVKVVGDRYPSELGRGDAVAAQTLASGIEAAVQEDATVILLPTITYDDDDDALRDAVAGALAAGVVVVASVGDSEQPGGAEAGGPGVTPLPAGYEGVIGVGAMAEDGGTGVSRLSHVDLVAPGIEIVTTYPGDGLGLGTATAFAAGYVAAGVALLRAYRPELSPAEVAHRLFATAAPAPEGVGSASYGFGIVDPYQAMVERLVDQEPAQLPGFVPSQPDAEELARQAARERADAQAFHLVLAALAVAVAVAAAAGFGTRGRRRRWRAGMAAAPKDPPTADHPEPPRDLLADLPTSRPR